MQNPFNQYPNSVKYLLSRQLYSERAVLPIQIISCLIFNTSRCNFNLISLTVGLGIYGWYVNCELWNVFLPPHGFHFPNTNICIYIYTYEYQYLYYCFHFSHCIRHLWWARFGSSWGCITDECPWWRWP